MARIVSLILVILVVVCHGTIIHSKPPALISKEKQQNHDSVHGHKRSVTDDYDEYIDYIHYNKYISNHRNRKHHHVSSAKMIQIDNENSEDTDATQYSDKEQIIAFLLSFFFGAVAAGRFYVGANAVAAVKLSFTMMMCCLVCMCSCFVAKESSFRVQDLIDDITRRRDVVGTQRENPTVLIPVIGATGVTALLLCCG
eukprot:361071_1